MAIGRKFVTSMNLNLEDVSPEDRLTLWMPQARALASRAREGQEIMDFLESKGISEELAGEAAAELWAAARSQRAWWKAPKNWIGASMMSAGLVIACFCLSSGGGVLAAIAACGFCGLGAAVFWGGYLESS
jgi:hypothetical protein